MQLALFLIFGVLAVAGAINLLLQRHPTNSALSLVVVMMSHAVLYWSLGAEFLAASQVIVYSGAAAIFCLLSFVFLSERHALGTSNIGGYLNHVTSNIAEISSLLFTK